MSILELAVQQGIQEGDYTPDLLAMILFFLREEPYREAMKKICEIPPERIAEAKSALSFVHDGIRYPVLR